MITKRKFLGVSTNKNGAGVPSPRQRYILSKYPIKSTIVVIAAMILLFMAGTQNKHLSATRLPPSSSSFSVQSLSFSPILLAGFRGLAADILWLRAADLQESGRYFELVQLAEWITTLEPHLTEVWAVHAWNMIYNISITTPDDATRWNWIKNGIHLLRDRGIPLNAKNPHLYSELAAIYLNKIGNPTDQSAQYYKRQWAKEMITHICESGYPDYKNILSESFTQTNLKKYKLIPQYMQEIDNTYGPLDWRVPQTHALYWAYLGNRANGTNIYDPRCERIIYQSMATIFEYGKLTYSIEGDLFITSTNFELLPNVIATFENSLLHAKNDLPQKAYANFLTTAIGACNFYKHHDKALELFDILHKRFPSPLTNQGFDKFTKHAPSPSLPQILAPKIQNN